MRNLRRFLIAITGGFVLLIGIAMIFLPGPSCLVIPAGLAILALEFPWARRWLERTRAFIAKPRPFRKSLDDLLARNQTPSKNSTPD